MKTRRQGGRTKTRPPMTATEAIRHARILEREFSGVPVEIKTLATYVDVCRAGTMTWTACELIWKINEDVKRLPECTPEQAAEIDRIAIRMEKHKDAVGDYIVSFWRTGRQN